ncbi:MAG: hypothetical protein AMS15_05225 [Planctomycetes bacterium DG_23]|nr:MAG: hypothetical protein AMS15_05225 [Planctomycetes bacterium DG_23]
MLKYLLSLFLEKIFQPPQIAADCGLPRFSATRPKYAKYLPQAFKSRIFLSPILPAYSALTKCANRIMLKNTVSMTQVMGPHFKKGAEI